MGKLVLRKTILRNMIDRVWAALQFAVRAEIIASLLVASTPKD
jgi:hypothetical protein